MLLLSFCGAEFLSAAPNAYLLTKSWVTAAFPLQLPKVVPAGLAVTLAVLDAVL